MEWLKSIAPALATALGGPLAGAAVAAIGDALGMSDATKDKIEKALTSGSMTGEQLAAIQTAEIAFKQRMAELGIDLERIATEDRDSARKREMTVMDWTPRVLAFAIIGGFLGMAYGVLFGQMQADSVLAGTVIGYLSAKAEQVAAYYFGSTAGSVKKSELLANAGSKKT